MKLPFILGIPIALTACTAAPELVPEETLAPAANTQDQIRHVHGPAVLSGYTSRAVKGPEDWRKLNEQQSPAKQGES
ncbi:hypothetical protein AAFO92_10235 [Roseovarius sp. CAU 1744]|uniref:hypothetical protein n=1 Tax=Roseovarius sp. CAU 1744 TaxID=3140368 RepID=UPI00325B183B